MKLERWISLRRITSGGAYISEIDGLRFAAIISVMFYHVIQLAMISFNRYPEDPSLGFPMRLMNHGDRGVPLFFAISGMVLGLPFARQHLLGGRKIELGGYLWRRVTRLEPPYLINLLLRFPLVASARGMTAAQLLPHLLASFFYLHGIVYAAAPVVHLPSWSLEIEVQFYLLAPLLTLLIFRKLVWVRRGGLVGLILLFSVIRGLGPEKGYWLRFWIIGYLQYFLVGLLLADLFLIWMPKLKLHWLWDALALPMWFLAFFVPDKLSLFILPWMTLVLFIAAFKGVLLNRFFRNGFVATVGGMCYSIYLTHSLVLQGCMFALKRFSATLGMRVLWGDLVAIPVALALGTLFFVLVERPCMDREWPNHLAVWLRARTTRRAEV